MIAIINDKAIDFLKAREPNFRKIIQLYGLPDSWSRPPGFQTLVQIILEQQVSLNSARSTFEKLSDYVGEISPAKLSPLTIDVMRSLSVSRPKARYILGLSELIENGDFDLESIPSLSIEEGYQRLISLKGIGPWTANIYLMFALQKQDIYPPGDIALINTIKEFWPDTNKDEIALKAQEWAPYRSAACYLLWHFYLKSRGRIHPDEL